jgi:PAS domain S-box-containing protein
MAKQRRTLENSPLRAKAEKRHRTNKEEENILFFDHSLDLLCIIGFDGYFKRVSPSFSKTLGWTTEELLAKPFMDFVHADDREATSREAKVQATGKDAIRFENRYLCRDGSCRWISWSSRPLTDKGLSIGVGRDITEHKRTEAALRESEAFYRTVARNFPDGAIYVFDRDLRFLVADGQAMTTLGYSREDVEGRTIREICDDETCRVAEERYRRVLAGESLHFDTPFRGRVFSSAYVPIRNELGAVIAGMVVSHDVTDRIRIEEELKRSHDDLERRVSERTAEVNRMAAAVENATEGIIITDLSWNIDYVNPAFTRYSGYTAEDVAGREMRFLRSKNADWGVYDRQRTAALAGQPYVTQYAIRKKDGSDLTVESAISSVKGGKGEIKNFIVVWRDVTDQLLLEEQLRQAHKMEAIGTLAGGIAHDFNNMLAVILGNAELALDEIDDRTEGLGYQLEQILKASKRARELVKQILTFSRKTRGQKKPLKLIPLVKETTELLRGSLINTIDIELDISVDSDTILGDLSQIQQVLMNLATNAAHAMREDGGVLTIALSEATFGEKDPKPDRDIQPGRYIVATVRDTGTGISMDVRDRIFEPFFTTKEAGQGTGMGLAVAFGIVKNHGGAITVQSKAGKGSTFRVFLPSHGGVLDEEPAKRGSLPRGDEKVLVVDDEDSVVEVASETLKRLGYHVTTAASGAEAWNKFKDSPQGFDLVITDHIMPNLTGMRLAEKMLAVRSSLPIILFTGYSETVSAEEAKAAGISEFLMKPIDARQLAETVRRVLDCRNTDQSR